MTTMKSQSNPFSELERMFERMTRQFGDTTQWWEGEGPEKFWSIGAESMRIDIKETDDEYVVTADLPGFTRDDVEVSLYNHTLRIEAAAEEHHEEHEEQYIRSERHHRSKSRSIKLPEEVDADGVSATMENGVLTVTLPRKTIEEKHSITIS